MIHISSQPLFQLEQLEICLETFVLYLKLRLFLFWFSLVRWLETLLFVRLLSLLSLLYILELLLAIVASDLIRQLSWLGDLLLYSIDLLAGLDSHFLRLFLNLGIHDVILDGSDRGLSVSFNLGFRLLDNFIDGAIRLAKQVRHSLEGTKIFLCRLLRNLGRLSLDWHW